MISVIKFLSAPVVNLVAGLILYLWLGCCIWAYDGFDRFSAFYGGLFVIAIDIFSYGFNSLMPWTRSKKVDQDLDD